MYKKVIYIVKTDLHFYPPCMTQIRYLKACGVNVEVCFASSNDSALQILDRENIPYTCLGEAPREKSKRGKVRNYLEFRRKIKHWLKTIRSEDREHMLLWIGTTETAIPMMGLLNSFHYVLTMLELFDDKKNDVKRKLFGIMSGKADAMIACEVTRAYLMRYWFGLDKLPYVMTNKPYELGTQRYAAPSCERTEQAIDLIRGKKFIIYQGIYWKLEYMKSVVQALSVMDSDYYFVLMGFDLNKTNAYEELRKLYDKVIEVPSLPAPLHLEITSHAAIGLVFYDDSTLNQAFCAPNKIYEYSGFGIPMLANKIPGLENTVGRFHAGMCVDFTEAGLTEAIRAIDTNYEIYSENAAKLYAAEDNKSVIERIIDDLQIHRGKC